MSEIKICSVNECSSQSKKYLSNNLLKDDDSSWKCDDWKEYSWVVLEIDKENTIDLIEIINASSAFVEVFVSNSLDHGFNVLIPVFSSMSPTESRNRTDCKRKFVFKSKHFSSSIQGQSWKFIKFVCSQPFNEAIRYGLSSVRVIGHKSENKNALKLSPYGRFQLKLVQNNSNKDFFAAYDIKYKKDLIGKYEEKPKFPQTRPAEEEEKNVNGKRAKKDKENERADEDGGSGQKRKKKPIKEVASVPSTSTGEGTPSSSRLSLQQPSTSKAVNEPKKKSNSDTKKKKKKEKPFDQLMSHVVFVLSGYENPLRSELRDKATAMGARYSPKWDSNCTHLICAFSNTPKYNEVKRLNGRIVSKKWILDSHSQRRLLEWRNYMVGTYRGIDTPDHSEQSDNDANADADVVANDNRFAERPTNNNTNGYDSDVIYDLDTEDDD